MSYIENKLLTLNDINKNNGMTMNGGGETHAKIFPPTERNIQKAVMTLVKLPCV